MKFTFTWCLLIQFFCAEPCPVLTEQLQYLVLYVQLLCLHFPVWYFLYWNIETPVIHYNIQILLCRTAIWARHFSESICEADCSYLNILFALIELLSIYYSFFLPFVFLTLNSNLVLKNACTPPSLLSYKNSINLLIVVQPRALMKWLHSTRLQTDFSRTPVDTAFQHIVFQYLLHHCYRGVRKDVIFLFGWVFSNEVILMQSSIDCLISEDAVHYFWQLLFTGQSFKYLDALLVFQLSEVRLADMAPRLHFSPF